MNPLTAVNAALEVIKKKPTLEALVLLLAGWMMYDGYQRNKASDRAHTTIAQVFERRDKAEEKRTRLVIFAITGKKYEDVKDEAKEAGALHEEEESDD